MTGARWVRLVRRVVASAVIAATLVAAFALLGKPVYVDPQIDQLRRADAVLVLGGPGYDRYDLGIQLAVDGWSTNLVISNANGEEDPWLARFCRKKHPEFELYCFTSDPLTTRGEAREFSRLAAARGWRSVIVVTFRPHISRARYIVQRCFGGDVIMRESSTAVSPTRWAYEYAYQTAGFLRAFSQLGC